MRDLVMDMRSMKAGDMHFLTAPVAGFGREGAQSVVYLDQAENQALWEAVREDKVARLGGRQPARRRCTARPCDRRCGGP